MNEEVKLRMNSEEPKFSPLDATSPDHIVAVSKCENSVKSKNSSHFSAVSWSLPGLV